MDIITRFPRTSRQCDSIMVVVDMLSKIAHFIAMKTTNSASEVAQIFNREIVRLHSIPKKTIPYRDAKFTCNFWKELFLGLGTELDFSTTYHLQTDGQKRGSTRFWRII